MIDRHPLISDLGRYADRKLEGEALFRVALHVFQCQECRSRLQELGPWAEQRHAELFGHLDPSVPESAYGEVTRRVLDRVSGHQRNHLASSRASAPDLLAELVSQPPTRRRMLIENSRRFRSSSLVEVLLAECRKSWLDDPAAGEELARLALEVIDRLREPEHSTALLNDFRCEAWSAIGNCRRILSDFEGTANGLQMAEEYRLRGSGDPMEEARLMSLRASFLRDQSRFDEALQAVRREIEIQREAGDRHGEGRAYIRQSTILRFQRRFDEARAALAEGSSRMDPQREPRVNVLIPTNQALYLAEGGHVLESRELLHTARRLASEVGSGLDRVRIDWINGLIDRRANDRERAASTLQTALDRFIQSGIPLDAALVSLDLARLRLEQGRRSEAERLAREALPVFATRNIQRETRAALKLLHQATA